MLGMLNLNFSHVRFFFFFGNKLKAQFPFWLKCFGKRRGLALVCIKMSHTFKWYLLGAFTFSVSQEKKKIGFRRPCPHGSYCLLEEAAEHLVVPKGLCRGVLPLVPSTQPELLCCLTGSNMPFAALLPSSSIVHRSTGMKKQVSFLIQKTEPFTLHLILWELLQEALLPKWDDCHAPGDCGNWSLAVCKEVRVLRIKNLSLKPISIVSGMICYLFCVISSILEITEGRFVAKVTLRSKRMEDQMCLVRSKVYPTLCIMHPKREVREECKHVYMEIPWTVLGQFVLHRRPELWVAPFCVQ